MSGSETELEEVGDAIGCSGEVGERGFPESDQVGIPCKAPALPGTEPHLNLEKTAAEPPATSQCRLVRMHHAHR